MALPDCFVSSLLGAVSVVTFTSYNFSTGGKQHGSLFSSYIEHCMKISFSGDFFVFSFQLSDNSHQVFRNLQTGDMYAFLMGCRLFFCCAKKKKKLHPNLFVTKFLLRFKWCFVYKTKVFKKQNEIWEAAPIAHITASPKGSSQWSVCTFEAIGSDPGHREFWGLAP